MTALSPREAHLLDISCAPIRSAFSEVSFGPYLVGSALSRQGHRDVDVRLMLSDDAYSQVVKALGRDALALLGVAVGHHLASITGLPIDFQFQQLTAANAQHSGPRSAVGTAGANSFVGDALLEVRS